ncbi:hypothetical protein [Pandoraea sp. PE-S2T-3]|uniref:hypothetical protein n=1 Tax=Pandoraea sp. PE-S2T-3 TaxID=1986993 RepID=UPI001594FED6|nr:hypothetical protein [Pandoraea sp. PE-S2T-3]
MVDDIAAATINGSLRFDNFFIVKRTALSPLRLVVSRYISTYITIVARNAGRETTRQNPSGSGGGKSGADRADAVAPYETNNGGGSVGESKNLGKRMTTYVHHSFAVIVVFGTVVRHAK